MFAIATLLLVVALSLLVTRVATVVLTATGMSSQTARFQARSAFTGAGFTTSESERVVDHPLRRRVIGTLMLLGNAGIVAAASSTILGFRNAGFGREWWRVLELVGGLLALVFISRSRWVDRRLTAAIGRLVGRYTDWSDRDVAGLLKLSGGYTVSEFAVQSSDWVACRSLDELALRREGIVVLGITRTDGRYLGVPTMDTVVDPGDILVVYGLSDWLRELDHRPAGPEGDRAHEAAVERAHGESRREQVDDRQARRAHAGAGTSNASRAHALMWMDRLRLSAREQRHGCSHARGPAVPAAARHRHRDGNPLSHEPRLPGPRHPSRAV